MPGTNISLGALKAYPMSPFLTNEEIDRIVCEIESSINEYKKNYTDDEYNQKSYISDDMVYRKN